MGTYTPAPLLQFAVLSDYLVKSGLVKPYTPAEYQLGGVILVYAKQFAKSQQGFRVKMVRAQPGGRDYQYMSYEAHYLVDPDAGPSSKYVWGIQIDRDSIADSFEVYVEKIGQQMMNTKPADAPHYPEAPKETPWFNIQSGEG